MQIKNQQDLLTGLLFLAAGVGFALHAGADALDQSGGVGPAVLVVGLGLVLALMGGLLVFKSLTIEADGGGAVAILSLRALLGVFGALLLFAFMAPRAGGVLAAWTLVWVCAWVAARVGWRLSTALASVAAVGMWVVLTVWPQPGMTLWPVGGG